MSITEKIYNSFLYAPYMFWWYPLTPSCIVLSKSDNDIPECEYFYAYHYNDNFLVIICDSEVRLIAFDVIEYIDYQRVYFI